MSDLVVLLCDVLDFLENGCEILTRHDLTEAEMRLPPRRALKGLTDKSVLLHLACSAISDTI